MRGHGTVAAPVGLARRTLSGAALFFFAVGASAPMTVLAGGVVATYAGTGVVGVPAAFPLVTAALALFTVSYVAMSRHVPHPGPLYAHVARGLGPGPGLAVAPLALLAYGAIEISLFGLIGVIVSGLLGGAWWVWALFAWLAIAALGVLHIAINARVLALLLVCEIAVVALFDVGAFTHPADGSVSVAPLLPGSLFADGVGGVFALSVAAFVGYESALAYGEEARGHGALARATFGSLLFIGVLYAVSSWALAVAVGPGRVVAAARDPEAGLPMSLLGQRYGPVIGVFATLLLVTSIFAAMLSFHNTAARYVFVLGRERVLPAPFVRIGRGSRAGAPVGGSLLQSGVALAVVTGCAVTGSDPGRGAVHPAVGGRRDRHHDPDGRHVAGRGALLPPRWWHQRERLDARGGTTRRRRGGRRGARHHGGQPAFPARHAARVAGHARPARHGGAGRTGRAGLGRPGAPPARGLPRRRTR